MASISFIRKLKYPLVIFLAIFSGTIISAQPTFTFASATPCTEQAFCVDVTVKDFTDITSLKFPIRWDPKVIKLTGIEQFNLPNLTSTNFDTSRAGDGLVFLNWVGVVCQSGVLAITRNDDISIFQLCFKAIGSLGDTTFVGITNENVLINDPEPIIVRRPPGCFNIGYVQSKSFISLAQPFADAGSDKVMICNSPFILLSGTGSTGPEFRYSWSTNFGSLPGDLSKPSVIAGAPGEYIFTVLNSNTGCFARDTLNVLPPNRPDAKVFSEKLIGCTVDMVVLNANLSSKGDTIAYKWTAFDGGIVFPGDEQKLLPRIIAPGLYVLEVRNLVNGCFDTDTARVELTNPPAQSLKQQIVSEGGTLISGGSSATINSSQVEVALGPDDCKPLTVGEMLKIFLERYYLLESNQNNNSIPAQNITFFEDGSTFGYSKKWLDCSLSASCAIIVAEVIHVTPTIAAERKKVSVRVFQKDECSGQETVLDENVLLR